MGFIFLVFSTQLYNRCCSVGVSWVRLRHHRKCSAFLFRPPLYIYIYNVIHRQTVLLYHIFSVWLDTREASSGDQNLFDVSSVGYFTPDYPHSQRKWNNLLCMYALSATRELNSWKEHCIYAYMAASHSPILFKRVDMRQKKAMKNKLVTVNENIFL